MKKTSLRSNNSSDKEGEDVYKEFIIPGSVCTITASEKHSDTVWFVKIKSKEETSDETVIDEYGNKIILSQNYFIAIYLQKVLSKKQRQSDKELAK